MLSESIAVEDWLAEGGRDRPEQEPTSGADTRADEASGGIPDQAAASV